MRIIEPSAEIITHNSISGIDICKHIEKCGRVCYKSEGKITDDSYISFIQKIIERGHEAVLEHYSITVKFVCDRGVSHEIVRHRLASYCQESTRYCNYNKEDFGCEIAVIKPCYLVEGTKGYRQTIPKDILTGEKFMEKSVNIGDQISQIIGIFYPHRIDTYVKFVRSQKYYGRYMDDWYLICRTKEELIDIYNGICEIAKELGIHINTKKTRIVKLCSSYKFLQVKYEMTEDGKLYKKINPKRVVCFRRKIKKLAIKVLEGTSTYENVENTFKSWMGAYYKLLTKVQRENLITLYEDLFNKRIDIVNKKMVITNKE